MQKTVLSLFTAMLILLISAGVVNAKEKQIMKHVKFKNNNILIAGNLFLPENFDENKKYPSIVIAHPGGGVKEQVSGLYAEKLSKKGFVTLAFDASYQGESSGEPRNLEDPSARVEDIRSAVDYMTTLPFVDINKIGALGICAGGGYTIAAAQTEKRIKAVVSISGADIGRAFREGWRKENPIETQIKMLEQIGQQRTAEANGAEKMYVPFINENPEEIIEPDYKEFYEYYRTPRGQHSRSINRFPFTSNDKIMAFDAFVNIPTLLTQPMLLIAGEKAGSLWHSQEAYDLSKAPKELYVVKGATHADLYDRQPYVDEIVNKTADFLNTYLDGKNHSAVTEQSVIFPLGDKSSPDYFIKDAWAATLVEYDEIFQCPVWNVTFNPGARNNWHSHPAGQILLVTSGEGWYQEKGKTAQSLKAGDVVKIAPNVVHWHGAKVNSRFVHIAFCPNMDKGAAQWFEPVTDEEYNKLGK